jgi:hypothetical protein
MTLQENLNPKKNPFTSYLGMVMSCVSMLMFTAPLFFTLKKDMYDLWYVPTAIGCVGLLLLLSPDTLVSLIVKLFERKSK